MDAKLAIVGSGAGGMGAALLLQSHGIQTDLYESHIYPGGCASWFQRGKFVFDVGATTLSGIGPNRPLTNWSAATGAPLKVYDADPGIVFHLPSKTIRRYRDFDRWIEELEKAFPYQNHRVCWKKLHELSERSWKFLPNLQGFPPRKLSDFKHSFSWLKGLTLLPSLGISLESFFRLHHCGGVEFNRFIDALCMISAQNKAREVPLLVGALSMTYPAETYAPVGGMKGLFSSWLEHYEAMGGRWIPKTKISSLEASIGTWSLGIEGQEEKPKYKNVIANLTGWSLSKILGEKPSLPPQSWGAFTLYAGVKFKKSQRELYHLVLPDRSFGVPDFFCSFSHPDDALRAPEGWQTVTISIHTHEEDWQLDPENYLEKKNRMQNLIWDYFKNVFCDIEEVKFLDSGTPLTFERYTQRPFGRVGGLPHRWSYPMWLWPSQYKREGLYQLGDTVFPGQGIVATISGALQWWRENKSKIV